MVGEPNEILAIVSNRNSGSPLMLIRAYEGRLEISAQSPAIGTPMRWLNPVGVADLDRDGRAEIAAVITPHIGGTLKVYRQEGKVLLEIAALAGFSNHVYGSVELSMSAPVVLAGKMRLLVPNAARLRLQVVGLENGRLVVTGSCPVDAPLTGSIRIMSFSEISVGIVTGRRVINPNNCPSDQRRETRG